MNVVLSGSIVKLVHCLDGPILVTLAQDWGGFHGLGENRTFRWLRLLQAANAS